MLTFKRQKPKQSNAIQESIKDSEVQMSLTLRETSIFQVFKLQLQTFNSFPLWHISLRTCAKSTPKERGSCFQMQYITGDLILLPFRFQGYNKGIGNSSQLQHALCPNSRFAIPGTCTKLGL